VTPGYAPAYALLWYQIRQHRSRSSRRRLCSAIALGSTNGSLTICCDVPTSRGITARVEDPSAPEDTIFHARCHAWRRSDYAADLGLRAGPLSASTCASVWKA